MSGFVRTYIPDDVSHDTKGVIIRNNSPIH